MSSNIYETWADGASALEKYDGETDKYRVRAPPSERHGELALEGDAGWGRIDYPDADGPQRGETFSEAVYLPESEATSGRALLAFAVQTPKVGPNFDGYLVVADHDQQELKVGIREDGEYTWPDSSRTSFDASGTGGQWNAFVIDFGHTDEAVIRARYLTPDDRRLASVSFEDDTYDGGGWGHALWSTSGEDPAGWLDYLRDTTPARDPRSGEGTPAPPRNLRQTDRTGQSVTVAWDHSPDYEDGGDDSQ